jgi:hypothetical protein
MHLKTDQEFVFVKVARKCAFSLSGAAYHFTTSSTPETTLPS